MTSQITWREAKIPLCFESARLVWFGSVWFGWVQFGSIGFNLVWFGSVWFGWVQVGSVGFSLVWFGCLVRLGSFPST